MRVPRKYVGASGKVSWRVRYRTPAGTEKSETFYDEQTANDFARVLNALGPTRALVWLDQQEGDDERLSSMTVDELFAKWMEWKSAKGKRGNVTGVRSERTLMDYRRMWRLRIHPAFGSMPANAVSAADVQDWVDRLRRDIEPKTIADYHSLLHAVYKWGIQPARSLVINDPCTDTDLPKKRRKQPKGLRPDEWAILYQAALRVSQDAADLLMVLVSTGWRWSEVTALQVMAVDHWVDGQGSHTYLTMGRVMRREGNRFIFVEDAKSTAGERRVRVTGAAEATLLRRIHGKKPTDLILTNHRGGPWRYDGFYTRVWKRPAADKDPAPNRPRILEEAEKLGLNRPDLTPHWLRHTHVGMLIIAGEPLTAIQRRLGHASIKTTSDTYGRMIEDASEAGLAKVAAMLGGQVPPALETGDGGDPTQTA